MPYVSCVYAPEDPMLPPLEEGHKRILCTDENGVVWGLAEDSDVGEYIAYKEQGGTVLAAKEET